MVHLLGVFMLSSDRILTLAWTSRPTSPKTIEIKEVKQGHWIWVRMKQFAKALIDYQEQLKKEKEKEKIMVTLWKYIYIESTFLKRIIKFILLIKQKNLELFLRLLRRGKRGRGRGICGSVFWGICW